MTMAFREKIQKEIKKILPAKILFSVQKPDNPDFGDYSSNAAFIYAKQAEKSPIEAARDLKSRMSGAEIFKKIEVVSPGFLNFWLSDKEVANDFIRLAKAGGLPKLKAEKKEKIQLEFVSANPTGPLTLANGRGGFLGDVLANVLEIFGHKVEREYYINDTGNQIFILGQSILASAGIIPEGENFYKAGYIKDWAQKNKSKIKHRRNQPLKLGQIAAKDFLKEIKNTLRKAKIRFNRFTSENNLHRKSLVKKVLGIFKNKNLVYEKEGAVWLKTSIFGDEKDRVLVTSEGEPTYFLSDAGHYLETKTRGFGRKINILGPDHYGYVGRIQAAAKILGLKNSEIIVTQAAHIKKSEKISRMSKRKGEFVSFDWLLNEVGADAGRFFFLARSYDQHIDFDLEFAKKKNEDNPVYYIQYAHARMASILRNARGRMLMPVKFSTRDFQEKELRFAKKILEIEEVLKDVASDRQIHRLAEYAHGLAQEFSAFYRDVRVLGSKEHESRRLFVIRSAKRVLNSLLDLMGISAPEKM